MRKIQFINDGLYHIYNRGTEKRDIFLNDGDYVRFIHSIYEFNNTDPFFNLTRQIVRGSASNIAGRRPRDLLVEIIAFSLMPNHYHLILRQIKNSGIAKFMQKIGTGYTVYFNQKNKRNGVLFQGRFKAIPIDRDDYLLSLVNYIHLNPVELIEPGWKEGGIKDLQKADRFLENYRWSSYKDYIGIKNFPSVINKELIWSYFKNKKDLKCFTNQRLSGDFESIEDIILE